MAPSFYPLFIREMERPTPNLSNMFNSKAYAAAAGIGAVAGLRSMTAPALISVTASQGGLRLGDTPLRFLAYSATAVTIGLLAVGELIADKLPEAPNRTDPGPLAARFLSGATCGAAICLSEREDPWVGALAGGIAAIGGAFAGYQLRRLANQQGKAAAAISGTVEDAIAVAAGCAALASVE